MMQRAKTLNNASAWFDSFNQNSNLLDEIRQRIRDRLYQEGTNAEGIVIGYYSFSTSLMDSRKKFNEHYNFYDTGEFLQSIYVTWFVDHLFISADAQKGDENLFEKYGTNIIGLTSEQKDWLIGELKKRYIDYARRILLGN